ncbi:GNAT family N-acetyltransferase [Mesonia sp. K7]|uniref:GNAT family N-acetyltransferase n=1 Tax=Mesonia sp. K7 TaxID=2218606 RepID=UPI0013142F46|nr:GNAT family N-acetyltransferase [Mesonia sp. K7]
MENLAAIPIFKNEDKKRFELKVDKHLAFIDYKETPNQVALTHTEVPEELSGKGVASMMARKVFDEIAPTNKKIIPICPFIITFVKRNNEFKPQIDERFAGYKSL